MYHGSTMPGFPYHPHRGFETITINEEGVVDHTDSLGAAGRFGQGDVQWMTAGKGVLHSEMFPLLKQDEPNPFEIFQIWLNLPRRSKFAEPHFKMLWANSIPEVVQTDASGKKSTVRVIAGSFNHQQAPKPTPDSWASDADNHVMVMTIKMEAGATVTLPGAVAGIQRTLYFYRGSGLQVDDTAIPFYHSAWLDPKADVLLTAGEVPCDVLILQGKPIGEPVVQYGPFVMNSQQEIQEAFEDYRRTQFGGWPWPGAEYAHDRSKGRFAKHADGTLEERPL